jgi:hypothetical protein
MKTKTIGQCKDCKWFKREYKVLDNPKNFSNLYSIGQCCVKRGRQNMQKLISYFYGCWYWKEKK